MAKRRLEEATRGSGVSPCKYLGLGAHTDLEDLDIIPKVAHWLEGLVRHYDALEWMITASGLQRSSSFPITAFHDRPLPISIEQFLARFRLKSCNAVILVAAVYLSRIVERSATLPVSSCTIHRLLLVAITVGAKFVLDTPKSNKVMASIAEIPLKELNQLEVKFLCGIQYELAVSPGDVSTAYDALETLDGAAERRCQMTAEEVKVTENVEAEDSDATVEGVLDIEINNYSSNDECAGRANPRKRQKVDGGAQEGEVQNNNYVGASPGWSATSGHKSSEETRLCVTLKTNNSTGLASKTMDMSVPGVTTYMSTPERRVLAQSLVASAAE
jgi:hypothetical protein